MIRSFRCKETEKLFGRVFSRKLPHDVQRVARRKLEILDAAETLEDLRIPPANRLEKLHGKRAGQHSIRINDQWRLCFTWRETNAHDVEIVDYH
ncbi:MAG: plasmid maintenance system killer family protein [Deltaproteobacteria bacterium]|jgi:proteic killer suppression protein|nr:MAG: plasmid maintenance system killer family protein [Deltaproteobacteria bacterium]